jgi:hypothetical protein
MNTAEHMVFAKPEVLCSSGSPGGGTYFVSSSKVFARSMSARSAAPGSGAAALGGAALAVTAGSSARHARWLRERGPAGLPCRQTGSA